MPASDPFFRWAGSKRKYVRALHGMMGSMVGRDYRECFAGGAALAMRLIAEGAAAGIWLNDANPELISLWQALIECPAEIVACYEEHLAADGMAGPISRAADYFYSVRELKVEGLSVAVRGARFLYLVGASHCGLWRQNRAGAMNAPYGHATCVFTPAARLREVAGMLAALGGRLRVSCGDFQALFAGAGPQTIIYGDPPYLPQDVPLPAEGQKKKNKSFTAYAGVFSVEHHRQLAALALEARACGAKVLISNHDTALAREIYCGSRVVSLNAFRGFNASQTKKASEVIFVYE